jgi:hypothetical protein
VINSVFLLFGTGTHHIPIKLEVTARKCPVHRVLGTGSRMHVHGNSILGSVAD